MVFRHRNQRADGERNQREHDELYAHRNILPRAGQHGTDRNHRQPHAQNQHAQHRGHLRKHRYERIQRSANLDSAEIENDRGDKRNRRRIQDRLLQTDVFAVARDDRRADRPHHQIHRDEKRRRKRDRLRIIRKQRLQQRNAHKAGIAKRRRGRADAHGGDLLLFARNQIHQRQHAAHQRRAHDDRKPELARHFARTRHALHRIHDLERRAQVQKHHGERGNALRFNLAELDKRKSRHRVQQHHANGGQRNGKCGHILLILRLFFFSGKPLIAHSGRPVLSYFSCAAILSARSFK